MRKQKRSTEMYTLVQSYLSYSGKRKDFCQENNITISTLGYWVTKYRKSRFNGTKQPGFIKLTPVTTGSHSLSIDFPNGIRIQNHGLGSSDDIVSFIGKLYKETL